MVSKSILQKGICKGNEDLGQMAKFGDPPCVERLSLICLCEKNTEVQLAPSHQIFICQKDFYVKASFWQKENTTKRYNEINCHEVEAKQITYR